MNTGLTETQVRQRLQDYLNAEQSVLKNQSYQIKDRMYTRANLKYIQVMIEKLQAQLNSFTERSPIRMRQVISRDW